MENFSFLSTWKVSASKGGGVVCRLFHEPSQTEILRNPASVEDFERQREVWGFPLLFPPNRIRGGIFQFEGRSYTFPLNDIDRGNHIHGFPLHENWSISGSGNTLEFFYTHESSASWMHDFTIRIKYSFTACAALQETVFENDSMLNMPLMLAFHSAFNAPRGTLFRCSASEKAFETDGFTKLPTGKLQASSHDWKSFHDVSGLGAVSELAKRDDTMTLSGAEFIFGKEKTLVKYIPDEKFKFWVLWNGGTPENGFLCAEPQTCLTNAADMRSFPDSGFDVLPCKSKAVFISSIEISNIGNMN